MSEAVRRIFVEKKSGFDVEARNLYSDIKENLGISGLTSVRVVNRYDIAGLTDAEYQQARGIIFAEPPVDDVYDEELPLALDSRLFAIEYLPGQYDQRADSAMQCIQILTQKERPLILSAKVIILQGLLSDSEFAAVIAYCINPVEARQARLEKPAFLDVQTEVPADVAVIDGFINLTTDKLQALMNQMGLAMSFDDLRFCQTYFRDSEKRNPTVTELRVVDTYWSDHCRHTTFLTEIKDVQIDTGRFSTPIAQAYHGYLQTRAAVYGKKSKEVCLMDIAVIAIKEMKQRGLLNDLDESEEINACSIVVPVDIDGQLEDWLVMFKNETHNHPTEIEPFGGAATCLGGAIRDPLSGRSYVYQAMRVTGSGDPRAKVEDTLPGKLPQRKITIGAAAGYSSYGNQIGLATGQVTEVYDEGFIAKRMEIGAVIAAAPKANVVRKVPEPGDVVVLLGGRTGRDGCGGATGSSKEHTEESLSSCGAEVQKGNPPTERKIQRLFRNPAVSTLIKKCNDFGAGGVSVAIGELTDGLIINLDAIPKKYDGLDGTELAISESQERMAIVVAAEDAERVQQFADAENLEATIVAQVTGNHRLEMNWRGQTIVNISREFLNTNGVPQTTAVKVVAPNEADNYFNAVPAKIAKLIGNLPAAWSENLRDLNICSQKGLVARFDSTIGAGTVLLPFGGKNQSTPAEGMVAKIPVLQGETTTATLMTYGYNPQIGRWSPFHGAVYAIVEAVTKVVAIGGDYRQVRLTLQEYFEKLGQDSAKWGKPFSALLGAFYAEQQLGIPAIGGKDSMSGTFMDLHVPPTLVAFAVTAVKAPQVISPEFKVAGSQVVYIPLPRDEHELPDFAVLKRNFAKVTELIAAGKVLAAQTVRNGGLAAAISKMSFGNDIGLTINMPDNEALFAPAYGGIVLEIPADIDLQAVFGNVVYHVCGQTHSQPQICANGQVIELAALRQAWEEPLEKIFPTQAATTPPLPSPNFTPWTGRNLAKPALTVAKPRIFIPVFPGTNCEYDTARAFTKAGGIPETMVVRNLTAKAVEESINQMVRLIDNSQIIALPGGFSAGDEPDGSGKFIATMLRNPRIKEAVMRLLKQRDGLMIGICNGFQALIKLGLVPYGEIIDLTPDSPTLTYNSIGRHISGMTRTRVASVLSPWFANVQVDDVHSIALSHGEGRFVASPEIIAQLHKNGQIATQYVDDQDRPSQLIAYNPNGSMEAIEGITSPDGRVLGKMGHSERIGNSVAINIPGSKDQQIFAAGVKYFS